MKKIIFKCFLFIFTISLSFEKVLANEKELLIYEIQNLIETNYEVEDPIRDFYSNSFYQPFWNNNKSKIDEFIFILFNTDKEGIPNFRYELDKIKKLKLSSKISDLAKLDILLTNKFVLLSRDLKMGIISPLGLSSFIKIEREEPSLEDFLVNLNSTLDVKKYFENIRPKNPEYNKLIVELSKLKKIKKQQITSTIVPNDNTLEIGMTHPNVIPLRQRLYELGINEKFNNSETFDKDLLKSIMLFQENSGLSSDGVVGRKTFQALNLSIETKLMQVYVNLERLRWLNFDLGKQYIFVNQANYKAEYVKDNNILWQSKVVVGLPDYQTAEFFDQMTHIIVNPTWHVPKSIAVDEYLPKIQEDPEFLFNNEMQLYVRGTSKVIDSNLIDMSVFTVDNFPFEIKQNPGDLNALGQVKFMFPNKYSIYMHDTPMKSLFSKDLRAFSHGCVRLARPFEFANALLSGDQNINDGRFYSALKSSEETRFNLENFIPVYLTYRTVIFDKFGFINYRPDIYGRDALIYLSLFESGIDQNV